MSIGLQADRSRPVGQTGGLSYADSAIQIHTIKWIESLLMASDILEDDFFFAENVIRCENFEFHFLIFFRRPCFYFDLIFAWITTRVEESITGQASQALRDIVPENAS